jgi:hypothetical protein
MALTPQDMLRRMVDGIEARTGRDFPAWVALAREAGIPTHKALTAHLKEAHGLNHNEAQWVAWEVTDPGRLASYDQPKDLVDELYSGPKAHLRPTYDALLAAGLAAAPGVTSNVCRTYTSLAVGTQFAILNPRTRAAIELELALPPDSPIGEPFKSSNPRFTRRLRVASPEGVDDAVRAALAAAAAR